MAEEEKTEEVKEEKKSKISELKELTEKAEEAAKRLEAATEELAEMKAESLISGKAEAGQEKEEEKKEISPTEYVKKIMDGEE